MEQKVYSVYDEKACAYARPFFLSQDGQAVRAFSDEVSSDKSSLHAHPEDYSLYRIGVFDDASGVLTGCVPVFLIKGVECVAK